LRQERILLRKGRKTCVNQLKQVNGIYSIVGTVQPKKLAPLQRAIRAKVILEKKLNFIFENVADVARKKNI
jgi:hypothetical protein